MHTARKLDALRDKSYASHAPVATYHPITPAIARKDNRTMSKPSDKMTHFNLAFIGGPEYRIEIEDDCNGAVICDIFDMSYTQPLPISLETVIDTLIAFQEWTEREDALGWLLSQAEDRLSEVYKAERERLRDAHESYCDAVYDQMRDDQLTGDY